MSRKKVKFLDACKRDWQDISSEKFREYISPGQEVVRLERPLKLLVSKSGGHRVFTANGECHYIPSGWIDLKWVAKSGCPHFVK